mmetsp:Transcript_3254/g.6835  ORF Transcript_3254/g.6835 Transcript_3254/m.6835 type:complete len:175 (-) Transcript_3254:43-567(-)
MRQAWSFTGLLFFALSFAPGATFHVPSPIPFVSPGSAIESGSVALTSAILLGDSSAELGFQAPPATTLFSLVLTVALSTGAYVFWDGTIVPQKRTELAKSKRVGEVKEYLDELKEAEDRQAEKWLLNDWLVGPKKKQPAVPFLPKKKFNSGDNPVLFSTAIIMVPVLLAAALHR